jgi:hypothetical protein
MVIEISVFINYSTHDDDERKIYFSTKSLFLLFQCLVAAYFIIARKLVFIYEAKKSMEREREE